MFDCKYLKKKNLIDFEKLNNTRMEFNALNSNFFEIYDAVGMAQRVMLRKNVRLLTFNSIPCGYIWIGKRTIYKHYISSMKVNLDCDLYQGFRTLLDSYKSVTCFSYQCEKNDFNYKILKQLGFKKTEGTLDMNIKIKNTQPYILNQEISFESFKKGIHESIRCDLQNEIFKNSKRHPLEIQDIYYDELQEYYFNEGSIFIKKGKEYIGYGQIIIDEDCPFIVNFGIIKKYRGMGYSKILLLYLLNIIKDNKFETAYIRVKSSNNIALSLYTSVGFKIINENYVWELRR